MKYILIVDDDITIGNMLEELLRNNGYGVQRAYSGTEVVLLLEKKRPDLVLLDLMLPGISGESLMPYLKEIPVIILSAKVDVKDKVNLLMSGAVDYMAKPFDTKELLARISVQLRKPVILEESKSISTGEVEMNMVSHEVFVKDQEIHLTKTEFAILKFLMLHAGQTVAKTVILERISEETLDCTENSLKQHISNLRKKLRDAGGRDYISAVWGIGFRLLDNES